MRKNANKFLRNLLEWVHMTMILSLIFPGLYMMQMVRPDHLMYEMYFASLFLFFPVMVLQTASKKSKKAVSYIGILILVLIVVRVGAGLIADNYLQKDVEGYYYVAMLVLSFFTGIEYFRKRLYNAQRKESAKTGDIWSDLSFFVSDPRIAFVVWFFVISVLAQIFDCPQICNVALFSGIVYLVVASIYVYVVQSEKYLKLNERVCNVQNIPYKRINKIGRGFLLVYVALILLMLIPAILTMNERKYVDVRKYESPLVPTETVIPQGDMMDLSQDLMEERETPLFMQIINGILNVVFITLAVALLVVGLIMLIYFIYGQLDKFAEGIPQDEDRVESLDELDEEEAVQKKKRFSKREKEPKIRKVYRKYIRKHRKEIPEVYETPTEIETAAGVAQAEETKILHAEYELVRYGYAKDALEKI